MMDEHLLRRAAALTEEQTRVLSIVMRTASSLSALGVITIIASFAFSRHLRNPMHRLVFINAFYNAFDVVCTMISVAGPKAGNPSSLCQFQGFLNQMFPVADVFWTLAMAINVWLIVFRRYDTGSLRKLELRYLVVITTITFIPALVFLFIRTDSKGPMYGSVTLWCAIAPNWVLFRIIIYYVPIWLSILVTIGLYCLVGLEIAKRRYALKSITSDSIPLDDTTTYDDSNHSRVPTAELDTHSPSGQVVTTCYTDRSASVPSHRSTISSYPAPIQRRPSLSFRQYILMPVLFLVALLAVWVAPTTNRVATFVNPSFSSYPLLLAVGLTGSLRGFWNGLIFVTMGMKSWKSQKAAKDKEPELPRRRPEPAREESE